MYRFSVCWCAGATFHKEHWNYAPKAIERLSPCCLRLGMPRLGAFQVAQVPGFSAS